MNKDLKPRKKSSTGEIEKGMVVTGRGIDINGRAIEFYGFISLAANDENLVSLEIYDGVEDAHCDGNHIKTLIFPDTVEYVKCDPEAIDYDTCKITVVDIRYEPL